MKPLSFAHFHSPIFFARRTIGDKIIDSDPKCRGVKAYRLSQGQDDGILLELNNETTLIPISNVISYTYLTEEKKAVPRPMQEQQKAKPGPKPKLSAQVQSPHDHVFQGQGAGKTSNV